jgi:hypothetical protein
MMKQKPVVLRQRRQEEGLSHEIMGNSVTNQEKRLIQSVKRKAASSQDQEATKEDTWSSNPSVEEDDRTQSCYRKKVGHLSQSFMQQKTIDT